MKQKHKAARWGTYQDEACQNCGKFVHRNDGYFGLKNPDDECSPVLRFCNEACYDKFTAFLRDMRRRAEAVAQGLTKALSA